ncbi:hypothetical protein [Sinisalibacter aestuarii]|uniref:Uncharacterized protein n=1 Tax=Sinisalibacter aestuarii TaxID=2949426 RepID=A0ABQ5LQG8_9RHOB|nr:hypothetical protein [Sinisalibacter aestuarii]GKY87255.1 hypothetical protein STA1M1_11240 [Sinisalibacter aestuarii]
MMIHPEHCSPTRPSLWYRIRGAHLPVERDGRSFAEHLAEITGLSPAAALRLELEYRRFLYLAALTSAPRVPPGLVRVAWSYHAEHEGYGKEFCDWIIGRRLTFAPTVEAPARAYAETVAAYLQEFGAEPPAEVWPAPDALATLPFRPMTPACAPLHV